MYDITTRSQSRPYNNTFISDKHYDGHHQNVKKIFAEFQLEIVSVGRRAGQSSFFIVIAITLIKLPGTETILNLLKKKYLTISRK